MNYSDENSSAWAAVEAAREKGARLVFTNGCFDILHVGHIRYLQQARKLGDFLVVGLNSDASVKLLKGAQRPVFPQDERREMLQALSCIDAVIVFEEETPQSLIEAVDPQVLVKGGDWAVDKIVGAQHVLARGGVVKSLPFVPGRSTSSIIDRLQQL